MTTKTIKAPPAPKPFVVRMPDETKDLQLAGAGVALAYIRLSHTRDWQEFLTQQQVEGTLAHAARFLPSHIELLNALGSDISLLRVGATTERQIASGTSIAMGAVEVTMGRCQDCQGLFLCGSASMGKACLSTRGCRGLKVKATVPGKMTPAELKAIAAQFIAEGGDTDTSQDTNTLEPADNSDGPVMVPVTDQPTPTEHTVPSPLDLYEEIEAPSEHDIWAAEDLNA